MGWFYGFKLHLIVNEKGDLLSVKLTPGNIADKDRSLMKILTKNIVGKLFADKGYISTPLFKLLWKQGLQLITKLKKNRIYPIINR